MDACTHERTYERTCRRMQTEGTDAHTEGGTDRQMGRDGMGWDEMGWNGTGRNGTGRDGMDTWTDGHTETDGRTGQDGMG